MPRAASATPLEVLNIEDHLASLVKSAARTSQNSLLSLKIAVLQLWLGKTEDYLVSSQRILKVATDSQGADNAERAAKVYCLRASSDPQLLEAALTLALKAVALGRNKDNLPWYQMTLGMAEYRCGNYAAADAALKTAAETAADTNDEKYRLCIEGTAGFFRVMNLIRQGNVDGARDLFSATESNIKPLPADMTYALTDHDDLIVWLSYKEAKAMLDGTATSEPDTPGK